MADAQRIGTRKLPASNEAGTPPRLSGLGRQQRVLWRTGYVCPLPCLSTLFESSSSVLSVTAGMVHRQGPAADGYSAIQTDFSRECSLLAELATASPPNPSPFHPFPTFVAVSASSSHWIARNLPFSPGLSSPRTAPKLKSVRKEKLACRSLQLYRAEAAIRRARRQLSCIQTGLVFLCLTLSWTPNDPFTLATKRRGDHQGITPPTNVSKKQAFRTANTPYCDGLPR
ncbi:hypothetical protein F4780DRAFT_720653 [Xylariomycetidae sp. FL0641]|nr:hypothetical protein F4780DRAFT_720653 [Xylariomycetidae sp. FL0641]